MSETFEKAVITAAAVGGSCDGANAERERRPPGRSGIMASGAAEVLGTVVGVVVSHGTEGAERST